MNYLQHAISSGQGAIVCKSHVQHIERLSRVPRGAKDSSAVKLDIV